MRLSALHSDFPIGCLLYFLFWNALLIQSSPTGSLEEKTLHSSWSNFDENPFVRLTKRRNTPTLSSRDRFLPGERSPELGPHHVLHRRNATAFKISLINGLKTGTGPDLASATEKMYRVSPKVNSVYLAIALIPAFIICYGSFSSFLKEKLHLGEAMLAVLFGILIGPHVAGLFHPRSWGGGAVFNEITLEITRIIVALDVFSAGVELPSAYILRHWQTMLCLLGPVVLSGWFISAGLIVAFVPVLSYLEALVIAACVCPTDILLASSVVGNGRYARKHVPPHLRHLLQAEAGANDGVAIILLYLAVFLLLRNNHSVGSAIGSWLLLGILYHIIVGVIMGVVAGIIARKTLKFCKRQELIDKESMVAMYITLALMTAGVAILAGADDIVAAFACGTAFAWDHSVSEDIEASNFSQILSHLVNTSAFIYVGATIPFELWNEAILTLQGWKMVLLALSILLLRRLPVMIILRKLIPDLKTNKEAIFCGHYGPIGVSGLFISVLATEKLPTPQIPPRSSLDVLALTIQPIMYLLLCFSVFVHGLSVPFFNLSKNFGSRVNSLRRSGTMTSSIRSARFNNLTRYDPAETDDIGGLPDERQSLSAWPPPSPTPTVNARPAYNKSITVSQTTRVNVDCDSDVVEAKATHDKHEKQPLIKDEIKMSDDWVEPHPVEAPDGTRMYKCGQHLIIEHGGGKGLEVWHLQPASVDKRFGPVQLAGPSDSPMSGDLERISAKDVSNISPKSTPPAQDEPPAEIRTATKFRMHHISQHHTYFPGSPSGDRGVGESQNGTGGDPTTSPSPVDSDSRSSEWEDETATSERTANATRSQSNRIQLRPRKLIGRPKSLESSKKGPKAQSRTGCNELRHSTGHQQDSIRTPSRATSPAARSHDYRSNKASTKASAAQTSASSNRHAATFAGNGEDREKRKSLSSLENSRAPSPSSKSKGTDPIEPKPRRRQGSQSLIDPHRRVSFVDPSEE